MLSFNQSLPFFVNKGLQNSFLKASFNIIAVVEVVNSAVDHMLFITICLFACKCQKFQNRQKIGT